MHIAHISQDSGTENENAEFQGLSSGSVSAMKRGFVSPGKDISMDEYGEFIEKFADELKKFTTPDEQVSTKVVKKNNGVYQQAIVIRTKDSNAFPLIYPTQQFLEYQDTKDIETIARQTIRFYRDQNRRLQFDADFFTDLEKAGRNIVCRIISREKNEQLLEHIPHKDFLNLAVVYYCLTDVSPIGKGAILIRNEHLKMWGISCETLDVIARSNTRKLLPYDFRSMKDMISSILGKEVSGPEDKESSLYVLSNVARCFGAVWITDRDVLETIGRQLNEDYYVLPSSVHECVVLPCRGENDEKKLSAMVREINSTQVRPEEVLADSVYRYSCKSKVLSVAAD